MATHVTLRCLPNMPDARGYKYLTELYTSGIKLKDSGALLAVLSDHA
jgi:hypothetical protein